MSLPGKSEKAYLHISDNHGRAVIEGQPQHIAELEALFQQHGIACNRTVALPGQEALELGEGVNRDAAVRLLESYQTAKGS
jgi:hypothetical protein